MLKTALNVFKLHVIPIKVLNLCGFQLISNNILNRKFVLKRPANTLLIE
ncbi:MAG: hypothetical protein ACTSYR_04040 [Candidatus Odinarchaeia archaeon]